MRRHLLALTAAAALGAAACADQPAPTGLQARLLDPPGGSGETYTVSGKVFGYRIFRDSTNPGDSTSSVFPLANVLVEAIRIGDIPDDSVPGDSVPGDSVPGDSTPGDSVPRDSVPPDSGILTLRGLRFTSFADTVHIPVDSGIVPPPPRIVTARDRTARDGSYSLRRLPRGIYEIDVTRGGQVVAANWIWVTGDRREVNFYVWVR